MTQDQNKFVFDGAFELKPYLRRVARRLMWVRSLEAIILSVAIVLACAAITELALILAGGWPVWSAVLALLPAIVVLLVFARSFIDSRVPVLRGVTGFFSRILTPGGASVSALSNSYRFLITLSLSVVMAVSLAAALWIFSPWRTSFPHWTVPVVIGPLMAVISAIVIFSAGVSERDAAIWLDINSNLGERLITALELHESSSQQALAPAVHRGAKAAIEQLRPHESHYGRLTRRNMITVISVLALAVVFAFVSPVDSDKRLRNRIRQQAVRQFAAQLSTEAAELEQKPDISAQLREHSDQLKQLSQSMRWGKATPEEAVSKMNRMESKLRESLESAEAFDSLTDRLSAMAGASPEDEDSPAAQTSSALDSGSMGELGAKTGQSMNSGSMTQSQADKWSSAMNEAAKSASGDQSLSEAFKRASEAAAAMDGKAFESAMQDAASAAKAAGENSDAAKGLASAADELARQRDRLVDAAQGGAGGGAGEGAGGGGFSADDINQAIARAGGQGGGQGSGQQGGGQNGGQGGGQSGGQGNGQGSGQGGGQSGGQSGGQGNGNAAGSGGSTNRDSGGEIGIGGNEGGGNSFRESRWARIYAPKEIEHEGETVRPTGQVNSDNAPPAQRSEFLAPTGQGKTYVPYEKAWRAAKQRSESDVSKQRIPVRLRKLVKDYYDTQ